MPVQTSSESPSTIFGSSQQFSSVLDKVAKQQEGSKWMLDELIFMAQSSKLPAEAKLLEHVISYILSGKPSSEDFTLASKLLALNTGKDSTQKQIAVTDAAIKLMGGGAPVAGPGGKPQATASSNSPTARQISQSGGTSLSVSGNTINTGRYIITFSSNYDNVINSNGSDGQVKIYDTVTKTWVDVCGDPHVVTSNGDIAHFDQNGLQIDLADGTVVQIKPGPIQNGVAWISDVAVNKNGQTVGATGMNGGTVTLTSVLNESAASFDSYFGTASETNLTTGSPGGLDTLSIVMPNGQLTALTSGNINLDPDAMSNNVLLQKLETLITSGLSPELQASLQNVFNTLLDKG